MKRIISLLFILVLTISMFAGCNSVKPLKITATIFPLYDFAKQVVGDQSEYGNKASTVNVITPTDKNPHSYQVSDDDIAAINDSDVLICIGNEEWLDKIDSDKVSIIKVFDMNIDFIETDSVKDEHVWMSITNVKTIVDALSQKFSELNSGQKSNYEENASQYKESLDELNNKFIELFDSKQKTIAVADRNPFLYLEKEYSLKILSPFTTCEKDMADLTNEVFDEYIDIVEADKQTTIYYTELSNKRIAQQIGMLVDAQLLMLHSCHNISESNMKAGVTYIELMEQNLTNLTNGLVNNK